jgi:hypothetical protein
LASIRNGHSIDSKGTSAPNHRANFVEQTLVPVGSFFLFLRAICGATYILRDVRRHPDTSPLFPWECEILALERIREADVVRILKAGAEIKMVNTRPVDSAHAHRAGCTIDVDSAAFQHSSASNTRSGESIDGGIISSSLFHEFAIHFFPLLDELERGKRFAIIR